jgi:hypothetical protein
MVYGMPAALPGRSDGRICHDFHAATRADTGPADGFEISVEHVLVVRLFQPSRPPAKGRRAGNTKGRAV